MVKSPYYADCGALYQRRRAGRLIGAGMANHPLPDAESAVEHTYFNHNDKQKI